ncbi:MAG: hypothetical protein GC162_17325 [Planctomycetes bacterium]|nr:hypothetical protein [Planctomycetota bacterium]
MLNTRLIIAAIIPCILACAGCDTFHGVGRTIVLNTLPSPEAVEQTMQTTSGLTKVTRYDVEPTTSWSLYEGTIHNPGYAVLFCQDDTSAFANVELKPTREHGNQLRVSSIWMNHVPTHEELTRARSLIDRLCQSLHQHIPNIPSSSPSDDMFTGVPD